MGEARWEHPREVNDGVKGKVLVHPKPAEATQFGVAKECEEDAWRHGPQCQRPHAARMRLEPHGQVARTLAREANMRAKQERIEVLKRVHGREADREACTGDTIGEQCAPGHDDDAGLARAPRPEHGV
jgi:hypothetical protein